MKIEHVTDLSISLTFFHLKITGFWFAYNRLQQRIMIILMIYTFLSLGYNVAIQFIGLYFCWDDVIVSIPMLFNGIGLLNGFIKMCIMITQKEKFLALITFMQKNFWQKDYDAHEEQIIAKVRKVCVYFICTFSFSGKFTVVAFGIRSLLSNIGKDESERSLIFPMFVKLLSYTPYYEITFTLQAITFFQTAIIYLCFDNMFSIMCLHTAGQFRVLQYRLENIHKPRDAVQDGGDPNKFVSYLSDDCAVAFKKCVRRHQDLIGFCKSMDDVFRVIMLSQVLMFSMLMCLAGYQLIQEDANLTMRITVIFLIATSMSQLWMFTYSCNTMTQESLNTSEAAYGAPWIHLSMDKFGRMIRRDLQLVIMRSEKACYVTAFGFFPISLETYTRIMSTAMSYFTLLRQTTMESDDS